MILTADVERKVGPTVIKVNLLLSNFKRLDHSHLTRRRSQILQTG